MNAAGLGGIHATTLRAIVYLVIGLQLLPLVDGIAKYLTAAYPVLLLAWGRYCFQLLTVLPVTLWRHGRGALTPPGVGLQVLRGMLLVVCTLLFFAAVARMPLADAIALVFVYPFLVTMLSALVFREPVGLRRWLAVAVGFIGVIVVLRPGDGVYSDGTPFALAAGSLFALYVTVTRRLAGRAPPLVGLTFTALVGSVVLTLLLPWSWQPLSLPTLGLMLLMGALTAIGHGLVMRAYELAPSSLLAPLGYTEIIGAVVVGLVMFGDFPDGATWLGIAIIAASGIYISWRESRRAPQRTPVPLPPG